LELEVPIEMDGGQGPILSLETLRLISNLSLAELPSFLLPLPTVAPRLARLELTLTVPSAKASRLPYKNSPLS
jgi:hypothetical protein